MNPYFSVVAGGGTRRGRAMNARARVDHIENEKRKIETHLELNAMLSSASRRAGYIQRLSLLKGPNG